MTNRYSDSSFLMTQVQKGKISRREFITQAAAIGAGAVLFSGLSSPASYASSPKKGGVFRLAVSHGSTTDVLNPAIITNGFTSAVNKTKDNHLAEITANGLEPELAEGWEASKDATIWRFKIRKGVEFHNGKTLDADDVVASINHHRKEDSQSGAKVILKPIVDIRVDGGDTVVVALDHGNADFPYLISDFHIPILPSNSDGTIDWQSGIGCGPYKLTEWEPGVHAAFTRHENYWKLPQRAHFDEVEILSVVDVTARTNALKTGQVDAIDRVDLKTVHLLEADQGVKVLETSGNAHYSFDMRTDTPPFDNRNVRLALKHAIDREHLLQVILRGHGYLGNDHPIGKANRYYASEIPQREYDTDKAKFYLKEAGLTNLKVDLHVADAAFPGAVDAGTLYREHAASAGIDINVRRVPDDGYWSNVWMKVPWCAVYWNGRVTEDWQLSTVFAEDAPWNDTYWKHERFNKLLVEARAELDEVKRREMYVEMQRIIRDDGGLVAPIFNNFVFAASDKIRHGELANHRDLDGYKLAERWWFA